MMKAATVDELVTRERESFLGYLRDGPWTLEYAHQQLRAPSLDLFAVAGLAMAIAEVQCEDLEDLNED
jgi:hypothetical protein